MSELLRGDAARLRLLYELGSAFAERVELAELCAFVLASCRDVLDAESASILLLDAERGELFFPYVSDSSPEVVERLLSMRFPAEQGIAGRVLRSGESALVDDVAADPSFYPAVDRHSHTTTRSLLCSPLAAARGAIGVVQVRNRRGGGAFSPDDLEFLDALAGSIAVALENARLYAQLKSQVAALELAVVEHKQLTALHHELDIAAGIQQSILPGTFPPFPDRREIDVFAAMLPAKEVGGDFYDFFFVDDHRLGFVVGDVSGKGMPAALFMAVSRTFLKSIATHGLAPRECLERVNELLYFENRLEMFVSVFYGVLDVRTGDVEYSNGGHNPPLVLRRGGTIESLAGTGGTVLGILPGLRYRSGSARLADGETMFLYSDGITEAMNAGGECFGESRLTASLARVGSGDPRALVERAVADVETWAAGEAQSDDITALSVTWHGARRRAADPAQP
ncbi:MAG TPA: GAF domain-containing SpoIIE family protein phosphatase [Candidatus Limnocylindrales bacterium]|nr:GAF domain-containing SpoIIE family protein phosphatase [Candidatus Limnocylindrales bacterium]